MARPRNAESLMNVVEPPRDGEFFFEEGGADERQTGGESPWLHFIGRHPAWSLGSAVMAGVLIASALLRF